MASGLAVENWKWYVKRKESSKSGARDGADCGPYETEPGAQAALDRRYLKMGRKLYLARLNIARFSVLHMRVDIKGG